MPYSKTTQRKYGDSPLNYNASPYKMGGMSFTPGQSPLNAVNASPLKEPITAAILALGGKLWAGMKAAGAWVAKKAATEVGKKVVSNVAVGVVNKAMNPSKEKTNTAYGYQPVQMRGPRAVT